MFDLVINKLDDLFGSVIIFVSNDVVNFLLSSWRMCHPRVYCQYGRSQTQRDLGI